MSDIAMLVAEEYERRAKNFKKGEGEFNMLPPASLLILTRRLKNKVGLDNKVWEPKTQIAIAASKCFFSA